MLERAERAVEPLPLTIVRASRVLVDQGAVCADIWRIETGALRTEVVTRDGRGVILDVAGPGDVVGSAATGPSPWTLRAIGPTRLRPAGDGAAQGLDARERRLVELVVSLLTGDVTSRVEARLVDLASRFGRPVTGGVAIPFALTQDDLAAMTASTRESVNRALGRLVSQDLVASPRRGRYVVRSQLRLVTG
jgi:CRP-like cAMP-binding protein